MHSFLVAGVEYLTCLSSRIFPTQAHRKLEYQLDDEFSVSTGVGGTSRFEINRHSLTIQTRRHPC